MNGAGHGPAGCISRKRRMKSGLIPTRSLRVFETMGVTTRLCRIASTSAEASISHGTSETETLQHTKHWIMAVNHRKDFVRGGRQREFGKEAESA
jgi:hypothetical protein